MLFRPARASDVDEICHLLTTAKRAPDYFHALLTSDPTFDPAQIRLAWTGGRIVACAKIYPRTMRIGTTMTAVAGIGHVRTDARFWQKGLATSLLSECLTAMYLDGMTLAPLFAPRHTLFARRGWHSIPGTRINLTAASLEPVAPDEPHAQVRAFDPHDLDEVMALYESVNTARTGSLVRGRDDWIGCLTALDLRGGTALVAHDQDHVIGYAATQPNGTGVDVPEMLLAPRAEKVWRPLLRGVLLMTGRSTTLCVVAPDDYRRLMSKHPGAALTTDNTMMLRTVEPARLLREISSMLALRLRDADRVPPLSVRIGPLRGGAVLRVADREVAVDHPRTNDPYLLPESAFVALLLGAVDARSRLDALPLPDDARETLLRLFPPQDWVLWRSDSF